MPHEHSYPIVGAFYRPPAEALLAVIPINTQLYLRAEPDNAYDPNAVAVFLKTSDFPERSINAFNQEGGAYGYDVERLKEEDEWHLGYLPRGLAAALRADESIPIGKDIEAFFNCSATGSPLVRFVL